jgi:glucosamine-6-phosphate deaminase
MYSVDNLKVMVSGSPAEMGEAVARHCAAHIRSSAEESGRARIVMATGNSQLPFVKALRDQPDVPWDAVTVFHMDEYIGLPASHPASFRGWIRRNVAEPLRPATVHYINPDDDHVAEAARYEELLRAAPIDLVCMGIGENGHLAFNEPGDAEFDDPRWVRVVQLNERSRSQQVDEGHFARIGDVPSQAISVTIPALLSPPAVLVAVPEERKAEAVKAALTGAVSPSCPASALRTKQGAVLFLDKDSSSRLEAG